MDAKELRHIGSSLYGRQWQTAMSGDVGADPRTVRRWAAGQAVPEPVARLLRILYATDKRAFFLAMSRNPVFTT
jgi:hypothetical protein